MTLKQNGETPKQLVCMVNNLPLNTGKQFKLVWVYKETTALSKTIFNSTGSRSFTHSPTMDGVYTCEVTDQYSKTLVSRNITVMFGKDESTCECN